MDSLARILKNMPDLSFMKDAEANAAKLLNDPLIQKLRSDHPEIDDDVLKLNMNRLYQYVTESQHCAACPGLERCPNDYKGHATSISVTKLNEQVQVIDKKVPCQLFINKQNQDAIHRRIQSFYVDEQALRAAFSPEDIMKRDRQRSSAVHEIMAYILATKENGLQKEGLFLTGPFGTGKTFLMCYMLYELAKIGLTGAIVYVPDFIENLKSLFNEPEKLRETVDALKKTDLLIFDDVGAENLNPWARDHIIGAILNQRMNVLPTFYTSNYDLDGLEKHFSFTNRVGDEEHKGMRIMDRIRPFVKVVQVNGSNQRGKD